MDPIVRNNQRAWEAASEKHIREHDDLLAQARRGSSLLSSELEFLRPLLRSSPAVVHLQSGNGLDDLGLVAAGARIVVGVDFSVVAVSAARRRVAQLRLACEYVVAEVPEVPLRGECADLVYTGKGALIWMSDLERWTHEAARLLRPRGHLFVHEAHPAVPLWNWNEQTAGIRADRSYLAHRHVNDTFPARGATEWQWTFAEIINAVVAAGLEVISVAEYPDRFGGPRASQRLLGKASSRTPSPSSPVDLSEAGRRRFAPKTWRASREC